MKMYLPSPFILRYVRAKMIVHAFMIELDQLTIDMYIYIKKTLTNVKFYVQSQWRVVLWYHRFWQTSIYRGRHTQFCIVSSLNRSSKFAQNFTVGFLHLLSTHPIHIVVWGNFPFKELMKSISAPKYIIKLIVWLQAVFSPASSAIQLALLDWLGRSVVETWSKQIFWECFHMSARMWFKTCLQCDSHHSDEKLLTAHMRETTCKLYRLRLAKFAIPAPPGGGGGTHV